MSILSIKKSVATIVVGMLVTSSSFVAAASAEVELVTKKLQTLQIEAKSINKSVVKGLYEVITDDAVFYVSADGQYLINGDVFDLNDANKNLTSIKMEAIIKEKNAIYFEQLNSLEKDMITYKADDEKHVVKVFTDPTCGYCQKLHADMQGYNDLGITIRYLAFPRGGLGSSTYNTMVSIWCSEDRNMAMDNAKSRKPVASSTCENTVKEQFELGAALGVKGTPALFLEDGTSMPGYLPPERLIKALEEKK